MTVLQQDTEPTLSSKNIRCRACAAEFSRRPASPREKRCDPPFLWPTAQYFPLAACKASGRMLWIVECFYPEMSQSIFWSKQKKRYTWSLRRRSGSHSSQATFFKSEQVLNRSWASGWKTENTVVSFTEMPRSEVRSYQSLIWYLRK